MCHETLEVKAAQPLLDVRDLSKTFYSKSGLSHDALISVSFSVESGSCLGIVGESGSGKSTLARIIAGLETETSGSVSLQQDPHAAPSRNRSARNVQMVFQDPYGSLDPRQKVGPGLLELLRAASGRRSPDHSVRMLELLRQVGLDERHASLRPSALSGGQRQRVAIARALALDPELLILDEAVSALDVSVQAQVLNLLSDIRESTGITYLFVSHDLGVVRQVAEHCIVLRQGHIVEQGRTNDVLDAPQHPYTQALLDAVPRPGWRPSRQVRH